MSAVTGNLTAATANTRKHVKYKKKLPEYTDTYGVEKSGRVIKRWVRRGKELDDLPPLDDPPQMAAWWRRAMDHQVPDKLLGFLSGAATPDPRATSGEAAAIGNPGDTGLPRDFSGVKSLDIRENVEALRQTHAITKHLLDEALHAHPPNETLTQLRQKNFERSFELLRKGEQSLIDIEKQRGGLVDPEPIRLEIAQLLETLRLMHETMPRRLIIELEKILPRRFQRVLRILEGHLVPAVEKTRADEENILRNLETLDGPESIRTLLAA